MPEPDNSGEVIANEEGWLVTIRTMLHTFRSDSVVKYESFKRVLCNEIYSSCRHRNTELQQLGTILFKQSST